MFCGIGENAPARPRPLRDRGGPGSENRGTGPTRHRSRLAVLPLLFIAPTAFGADAKSSAGVLTGQDALGDGITDAPGVRRKPRLTT